MQKFTLRHLKLNRRRTLITLIGVILAVAMLTAVTGFVTSFIDSYRSLVRLSDGAWVVAINDVPVQAETEEWMLNPFKIRHLGEADYQPPEAKNPKALTLLEFDSAAFTAMHCHLDEGAWPVAAGEVLTSRYSGLALGQTITALFTSPDATTQERTLTIVGFLDRDTTYNFGENPLFATFDATAMQPYTLFIDSDPISPDAVDHAHEANARLGGGSIIPNSELLRVDDPYGSLNFLYTFGAILMVIIVLGATMVIYNSFAISTADRVRQAGILRSVGATRGQLFASVLFEALLLCIAGIPLGLLTGMLVEYVALGLANNLTQGLIINSRTSNSLTFSFAISWQGCLLAGSLAMLTVFLSSWIPALRMARVSPIEAIRLQQEIKLSRKQVRTPRWVTSLFGFEGTLALKTLQRYRSKYRATIFSLVTSIVLFLAVSSFATLLQDSTEIAFDTQPFNVSGYIRVQPDDASLLLAEELRALPAVEALSLSYGRVADINIPQDKLTPQARDYAREINQVRIHGLDERAFTSWCQQLGIDPGTHVTILVNTSGSFKSQGKAIRYSPFTYSIGDQLSIELSNRTATVTFSAITTEAPFGITPGADALCLVTSELNTDLIADREHPNYPLRFALQAKDPAQTTLAVENLLQRMALTGWVGNEELERSQNQNINLLVMLFTYGFVGMLSLIAVTSVIGAISTTINLRRREFAMLRSVGLAQKGFTKMLYLECLFYGLRSLLWGLPLGLVVSYWLYNTIQERFTFLYEPPWGALAVCVSGVFLVVSVTMLYSGRRASHDNIVDTLRLDLA